MVERMCSDFSGQCCTHKSSDEHLESSGLSDGPVGPRPGPSSSNGPLTYTPNCSSCNKLTSEGAYKCRLAGVLDSEYCRNTFVLLFLFFSVYIFFCFFVLFCLSVCPSCILCEMCRHSHDPSHNLVRTKTPLSIPEHGMSGELR